MQANMTFGVCDLPQAGGVAPAPGAVSNDIGFGYLNSKPAQLQWLLGTAFVALLLSLWIS
jgi:hypothetical protein